MARNVSGPPEDQVHEAIMAHQRDTGTGPPL
jgi:hypothetical protein